MSCCVTEMRIGLIVFICPFFCQFFPRNNSKKAKIKMDNNLIYRKKVFTFFFLFVHFFFPFLFGILQSSFPLRIIQARIFKLGIYSSLLILPFIYLVFSLFYGYIVSPFSQELYKLESFNLKAMGYTGFGVSVTS